MNYLVPWKFGLMRINPISKSELILLSLFGQNEARSPKERKNYSWLPLRLPTGFVKPVSNPSYCLLQNKFHVGSQNHRFIERFGLEGTFRGHLAQPICSEQGHLQLDQDSLNEVHFSISWSTCFQFLENLLLTRAGIGRRASLGHHLLISPLANRRYKRFLFPLKLDCFGRREAPQHTGYWDVLLGGQRSTSDLCL